MYFCLFVAKKGNEFLYIAREEKNGIELFDKTLLSEDNRRKQNWTNDQEYKSEKFKRKRQKREKKEESMDRPRIDFRYQRIREREIDEWKREATDGIAKDKTKKE